MKKIVLGLFLVSAAPMFAMEDEEHATSHNAAQKAKNVTPQHANAIMSELRLQADNIDADIKYGYATKDAYQKQQKIVQKMHDYMRKHIEYARDHVKALGNGNRVVNAGFNNCLTHISFAVQSQNSNLIHALLERGARVDIPHMYLLGVAIQQEKVSPESYQILALMLDEGASLNSLIHTWGNRFFDGKPESIHTQLLAFLLMYLKEQDRLEELQNLRDEDGRTLREYVEHYPSWKNTNRAQKEIIMELLSNPERAAELYPELEEEFEKCQELRRHRVYRRAGSKGIQI